MVELLNNISRSLSFLRRQESRKVKASTLVEVLVASILIIVVFTIASLSLNNIFKSTIKGNTIAVQNELNKLNYLYQHQRITNSYTSDLGDWEISLVKQKENVAMLQAKNTKTQKLIIRKLSHESIK